MSASWAEDDRAVGEHADLLVLQHEEEARYGLGPGGGADHAQPGADDVGSGGKVSGHADFSFAPADHEGPGCERILDGLQRVLFRDVLALGLLDGHVLGGVVLKQARIEGIDDLKGNAGLAAFLEGGADLFRIADQDRFDKALTDQFGGGRNHALVFTVGVDHHAFLGAALFQTTFEHAHFTDQPW